MTIRGVASGEKPQDISRNNEVPPIVDRIARYGAWIGAGLFLGFWIHSAFLFAGAAFFAASFVCTQIVRTDRSSKHSAEQNSSRNPENEVCIGKAASSSRPPLTLDVFNSPPSSSLSSSSENSRAKTPPSTPVKGSAITLIAPGGPIPGCEGFEDSAQLDAEDRQQLVDELFSESSDDAQAEKSVARMVARGDEES